MKNVILLGVLIFSLGLIQTVSAKDLKVGVVDIARVLEESPQADKARNKLQMEFSPREKKLIAQQKKLRDQEDQLLRDGAIMSDSERSKLERKILSGKRDFKREQDAFREDLSFKRNEILDSLQRKLIGTIQAYAKSQGYDILLAEGVVYASDTVNITESILENLKQN